MIRKHVIWKNHYSDSVALMRIAAEIESLPNVHQATIIMATEANLEIVRAAKLIDESITPQPNNLLIALLVDDETSASEAFSLAKNLMDKKNVKNESSSSAEIRPKSIEMLVTENPNINLALISVPGEYAFAEAKKALNLGLHVMLFSDNVAIEDELALKTIGRDKDLLVMGPDCGTSIINGQPLGFANEVEKGPVGIVAASGTGLQQVSCLLSHWGVGISQAIGTGGRDLSSDVGGITMLQSLAMLQADGNTEIIVLISKPPNEKIVKKIIEAAREGSKPVVICFLGVTTVIDDNVVLFAGSLDQAASMAYVKVKNGKEPTRLYSDKDIEKSFADIILQDSQKYLRGIYSGGTFCYEAQIIIGEILGPIWSSTPFDKNYKLINSWVSQEHTIIDLGDDEFTQGRPHPMIDHRTRHQRILEEATDPETAVILFDVVIGYSAHDDPAFEMAHSIREARKISLAEGRQIYFVGFVCGTAFDEQNFSYQVETLKSVGVILAESNAKASHLAASLAQIKNKALS